MTIRCDFHFYDESGSNGQFRLYLPETLNISEISVAVNNMASALRNISGASLTQVNIRKQLLGDYNDNPSVSAEVSSALWAVYCDDNENYEGLYVPFVSVSLMEQNGRKRFLRLDEVSTGVINIIEYVQSNFSDVLGNPLGEVYEAGIFVRGSGGYTLPKRQR